MALYLLLGLSLLFSLRALVGWRTGVLLMIVLAAVQDPLRKLVPGTPGWLVLVTAPVFLAIVFASMSRTRGWWPEFRRYYPSVGKALMLLALLALPAALVSATYGPGSWMLTMLGAFSYSLIFLAVIAGFHFARNPLELRRLLALYCLAHGAMLSGALLEYLGLFSGWRVLGTDALGYDWIRWGHGYTLDMIAGFYRSADVMGWHAAAVCMLSIVLATTAKGRQRSLWIALSALAIVALLLCGRRKMVYMLPIFFIAIAWIYWRAGRAGRVVAMLGLLLIPVGSVWVIGDWIGEGSANIRYYRGEGVAEGVFDRFEAHGFRSLVDTYNQSGFFGEGLGMATPGAHHIPVKRPRIWQESASSRILVELGVPGTLGFLFVMAALAASLWRVAMEQLRARTPMAQYAAGLVAFFLANVGSLTVSGQILADPFIASFLGLLVGVVLSLPRLAVAKQGSRNLRPLPTIGEPLPR